jgi:branched-chain amino acid transport system substrate-binding protein
MKKVQKGRKMNVGLVLLLVMGLLIGGCGSNCIYKRQCPSAKDSYKIGAVIDISGNSSSLGVPERDTLQMMVEKINAGRRSSRAPTRTDIYGQ